MKIKYIYIIVVFFFTSLSSVSYAGDGVIKLNSANFSKKIRTSKTTLVKFYSPECMPCVMMDPEFSAAAKSVSVKALFAEINVVKHPNIAKQYNVQTIPTTILFRDGREIDRLSSFLGREQLEQWALEAAN